LGKHQNQRTVSCDYIKNFKEPLGSMKEMAKSQQFFSRELLGFINKTKIDNRDYM
jgi:hypothetical protein